MEEEANSWIRRTKFSYRFDCSRLASLPLTIEQHQISGLKSRPIATEAPSNRNSKTQRSHVPSRIQRNLITNKQRSLSPLPQTTLSNEFKEAKSEAKRLSTPHPKRKVMGRLFSKDQQPLASTATNTKIIKMPITIIHSDSGG